MLRVNTQAADNEVSRVEFCSAKSIMLYIGGTNHTISDPIDTDEYVSRVFKVCQRCMNFLHESVIGNFENCSYFYFASYIDPRSWQALFLRGEAMLETTDMNSYRRKIIDTNILGNVFGNTDWLVSLLKLISCVYLKIAF